MAPTVYEECIRIGENADPYCYHGKGQALSGLKRYTEAIAAYEQALDLDAPDPDPQFYHEIGQVYEALAQQAYEREKQARLQWKPRRNMHSYKPVAIRAEAFELLRTLSGHTGGVYSVASVQMGSCWPVEAMTRPSGCGTGRAERNCARSAATGALFMLWRLVQMDKC